MPMPTQCRNDAVETEERIGRVSAGSQEQCAAEVRGLFVELLDFSAASGQVSLAGATGNVLLPDAAKRVAAMDGVHVLSLALPVSNYEPVRIGRPGFYVYNPVLPQFLERSTITQMTPKSCPSSQPLPNSKPRLSSWWTKS